MFPCGIQPLWRFLHNGLRDLTIYELKGEKHFCDWITMPHVGWLQVLELYRKSKKPPLGNHVRKNSREEMLPTSLHQWLVKRDFFKSIFTFFCFKTERCSNPLFIVRVVWDWPKEIASWWQRRGKGALPKRASEVNGPVSMLTVKSWLEPSGASEALSTSAVLKIILKGKQKMTVSRTREMSKSKGLIKTYTRWNYHQAKADFCWESIIV